LDRRTVGYVHVILHRAFKDAVRWGRLSRNPADAADPPRAGQQAGDLQAWDAPTLRRFIEASRQADDRLHALWVALATTGMRRGEGLGLRWSDLHLDAGRLRIVQTIVQTRSLVSVGQPKTDRGRRSVALDHGTLAALRDHRRRMLEERLLVGADFDDLGLVFHQPPGRPGTPRPLDDRHHPRDLQPRLADAPRRSRPAGCRSGDAAAVMTKTSP
ncbi:MAG: hypothetical protein ACRDZ3_04210, partial [Acidimicrobiia bacterium]